MSFAGPIVFSLMGAAFIIRSAALAERFLRRNGAQASFISYDLRKLFLRLWFIFLGALCIVIGISRIWLALS
jgi:hypothetical protein